MNVKELIDKLSDFGDHVRVITKNDDDHEGSPVNEIREVEDGYAPSEDGEGNEFVVVIWAS